MTAYDAARLADEAEIRSLIMGYASAVDRRSNADFGDVFAPDAVLEGPGFRNDTPEKIAAIATSMPQFVRTYHTIHNYVFDVQGDSATGTVYSAAHHLTDLGDNKASDLVMYITYYDSYRRGADGWKIAHREVDILWTQTQEVNHPITSLR